MSETTVERDVRPGTRPHSRIPASEFKKLTVGAHKCYIDVYSNIGTTSVQKIGSGKNVRTAPQMNLDARKIYRDVEKVITSSSGGVTGRIPSTVQPRRLTGLLPPKTLLRIAEAIYRYSPDHSALVGAIEILRPYHSPEEVRVIKRCALEFCSIKKHAKGPMSKRDLCKKHYDAERRRNDRRKKKG